MAINWPLEEARLLQHKTNTGPADATQVTLGAAVWPPPNKVWIVTGIGYQPSVTENQIISMTKTNGTYELALMNPIQLNLVNGWATCLAPGEEIYLFPGEYLKIYRQAKTAGSTMTINVQLIEIDLPIYHYEEPHIVHRTKRLLSEARQRYAGAAGGGGHPYGPGGAGGRGGRGGAGTPA